MIVLDKVNLQYGQRALFDDITVSFSLDQRVGVIGRNGAGKSTFLKVVAGQQPVEGTLQIPKSYTIAYMPQEMVLESTRAVLDETMQVFAPFLTMQARIATLEQLLASQPDNADQLLEEYSWLQQKIAHFDHSASLARATYILKGLGFTPSLLQKSVDQLSVGWKMRVVLAQLLLQDADFYLFDEPTNHLDLVAKEWFFEFLRTARFGFLLVSHDRYFLDNSCSYTFELDRGNGILYHGGYSKYMHHKEQQNTILQASAQRQEREIVRKQETIDRFKAKASKAKMAKSMMKQLEKIERIEVEPPPPVMHLTFPPVPRSGSVVLTVEKLAHAFESQQLFGDVSFELQRGMRMAVVAPNGTGKTTLFNLLTQKYDLQTGKVTFGYNVKTAFFEQDQTRALNAHNDILTEVQEACPTISHVTIRSFLGSFLFSGQDVYKKISMLSGGEKNRVAMVKVLLQHANLLILDEPTNHLDIPSQEILLKALQQYEGTMLLVSHDFMFVQEIATHILELTADGTYIFPGTYQEYRAQKKENQVTVPVAVTGPVEKKKNKLIGEDKEKITLAEKKIAKLEKEKKQLDAVFLEYHYGSKEYDKASLRYRQVEQELAQLLAEWEQLNT